MTRTVYVVARAGTRRDEIVRALDAPVDAEHLEPEEALDALAGRAPGRVVVDLDTDGALLGRVLGRAAELAESPDWTLDLVAPDPPLRLHRAGAGATRSAPGELELGDVLHQIARARHDINNPLTSAMAETQLLLLDIQEPEAKESLEMIESQLRRIRDLLAATGHLRPPAE